MDNGGSFYYLFFRIFKINQKLKNYFVVMVVQILLLYHIYVVYSHIWEKRIICAQLVSYICSLSNAS